MKSNEWLDEGMKKYLSEIKSLVSIHGWLDITPKKIDSTKVIIQKSPFLWTEYKIWADFGPVGSTEKKKWAEKYATLEGIFFMFSRANIF